MTFHIGAQPGEIAETCLLPGDPYRARWAAERFLQNAKLVSETRGMLGYTGTWRGNPVTIHGTGMGMPSLSIYANELIRDYGAQTLIRVGSCGALQPHIGLRDVVLAQAASTIGSPSTSIFREMRFAPVADFGLLSKAYAAATGPVHVGGIFTSDTFYDERTDLNDQLQRHGCLAVEMETAELYTLSARYQRRALAILTVSDHILTGEALPSADRETSFAAMIEMALHAAFT
ncbi:MAG: purine-nucleoside phosphorylase [Pseudotabrizicola sp.]|uniref:purine-nucleoside phosphorylase n=1 Tax=Pseudotabrizicola sp. TaxID=2939647 RepID=UPI002730D97F|nr:purine-nucleoside phosphorylase [Pseudotabrizicola sp.]MDP2079957.1 purine-nucleoside phosphorylase [Pseudotabrizicola sp.]MDZ7575401.1 purine-nucleoside phosphorylase [Pseudotabrizicola sp.]